MFSRRVRRFVLTAYQMGLMFYPAPFRKRNSSEMSLCASEMIAESSSPISTSMTLAVDLFQSLITEHLMTDRLKAFPQLAILLTITTVIAGTGYVISQQVLRASANDPQIQLAEDGAQRVSAGESPAAVVSDRKINMESSLAPFVIIYDNSGRPVVSSGFVNGTIPTPPKGVFDYVRANRQDTITWQPRPNVRIASVIARSNNGFVIAGRNMREIESREFMVFKIAAAGWLIANLILTFWWALGQFLNGAKVPGLRMLHQQE
jgi:hypothetical protein